MRVFLSAGEASGDAYAAALVQRLRDLEPDCSIEGIGGRRFAAASDGRVLDSSRWGAISITQSILVAPRVIVGFWKAQAMLRRGKPGLLIPIDFGYFNIRLARYARGRGWKVLYFMPPASWRRDHQGRDLPAITDAVVTPFPWSAELLEKIEAKASFFGHPLKELIASWRSGTTPLAASAHSKRIAVLPGSRKHEIARNLPVISRQVADPTLSDYTLEFAVAPTADLQQMKRVWNGLSPGRQDIFAVDDVYGVLDRAEAAVVCSGTATLEAALLRRPMVVIYQITKAMVGEAKLIRFKVPEFISLPNILLQRRLVPEFLALEVDADAVRKELVGLLKDDVKRQAQLDGFGEIDALLGPSDAITKAAELAVRLMLEG